MKAKEFYTKKLFDKIDLLKNEKENQIFVILGQSSQISYDCHEDKLADPETFKADGNESIFSKEWFAKIFLVLNQYKEYHLLSFAQFSYLISYIDPSFFAERVLLLRDNLRKLFPLNREDYFEKEENENLELRPNNLPIYQAEQFIIKGKHYYSVVTPINSYKIIDLFDESMDLTFSDYHNYICIDISSDPYSIDIFVNERFEEENFNKHAIIKLFKKQSLNVEIIQGLQNINWLLCQFEGTLSILENPSLPTDYKVNQQTLEFAKQFWGFDFTFRDISVYRNPDFGNTISNVSQALIVDLIIAEYENTRLNRPYRDVFLTAPTGSGKSLLFQLPAFYVSAKGDVTIVVSPLIALMKDQVDAIISERNFNKVVCINSELNLIDRERIIESCKSGEIDILYMSPELLLSYDITHFIGDRKLGLLVVDEAHLITTWGRDFRVDYWFLGNHIRKIRKYNEWDFPMVAVTATAIYGGANDMVFDSIDSLIMHDPHIFIGQVKRDDIEFVINNYERFTVHYESNKILQTVDFIQKIHELNLKTLVYTPYTKHIRQILEKVNSLQSTIATGYHGSMETLEKEYAYRQFKSGEKKVMISTKAFGMGVDIPDIQIVYHHAPSGLLPDYVQEIGRAARLPSIEGFAVLNYSTQDQRYTKALHGMSALRQYQLKEVLKKIHKSYLKNDKNRNLLLAVDDFGHIFENAIDLDQKVLTALMMIEKDYLAKTRFNVIIARPKKLFVKVYARISMIDLEVFQIKYQNTCRVLQDLKNGNLIIELDIDSLWSDHFRTQSFPLLKRHFYNEKLFNGDGLRVLPQLKISYQILFEIGSVVGQLQDCLHFLQGIFSNVNGYFTKDLFKKKLTQLLNNNEKAEKLSRFVLATYSGQLIQPGVIEPHAFLQQKRNLDGIEYRVFNNQYLASFAALLRRLSNLFSNPNVTKVEKFVTNKESNTIDYVRLGYFLEILELGTFEIKGGDKPVIFLRINDPHRIERDSKSMSYVNILLKKTLERHSLSNQIFDHFFLRYFSNEERWNFIEDFFLGENVDELMSKYTGAEIINDGENANRIDIIETLKKKEIKTLDEETFQSINSQAHIFPPSSESFYCINNLLTIENDSDIKTMRVSEWLRVDPVLFDKIRRKTPLKVHTEVFELLVSKLNTYHREYVRDVLGLKQRIKFKGYPNLVQASVLYTDKPVEFYKWWLENPTKITLTTEEKIKLLEKVYSITPSVLKKVHMQQIKK